MKVTLNPQELAEIYSLIQNIGLSEIDHIEISDEQIKAETRKNASRILSETKQDSSL